MTQQLALGIDLGGTKTAFGIVNREGKILAKDTMSTTGHERVEDYVSELANRIKSMPGFGEAAQYAGVGVGAPNGNYYTGQIVFAPNLPWKGEVIPLAKMLTEAMGIPCTLTNDANAAALGEMKYGVTQGMKDFVMVTLGTGVGSGFVANGQLIYGNDGFAGELGHVIAVHGGRVCGCGRKGCLEIYCSATGIALTANEWLERDDRPSVLRQQQQPVSAKDIHDAAEAGDEMALELFAFTGEILGRTLSDIVAITSPEAFVFFGGLAQAGDMLFKHVHQAMEDNMLPIYKNKVAFKVSSLPDADAAILGASALVW